MRQGDMAGGMFWAVCGAAALLLLGWELVTGVGWVYYSPVLLLTGGAMGLFGQWLIRRSLRK